jgi:pimeloyl-ACP methyl ester carboxylesterase
MYRFACVVLAATALLLAGCYPVRNTSRPPAVRLLAAPRPAQRVVIVLPGIADNLASLEAGGIGRAVRGAWPDADVVLVEMTIGYYKDGRAMPDLHQIIRSARERGYRKVWLVGASLGGMGAILYDTTFPCDVDGIVLLAPFLGDRRTLDEVRNAGGLGRWVAPPAATPGPGNWQLQIWRRAKVWSSHPPGDARVWLAYGDRDKFAPNMSLLSSAVPADHVITAPGVHEWTSWTPMASKVFAAIDLEKSSMAASPLPPVSETCIKD